MKLKIYKFVTPFSPSTSLLLLAYFVLTVNILLTEVAANDTAISQGIAKSVCNQRLVFIKSKQIQNPIKIRPNKVSSSNCDLCWYQWQKTCKDDQNRETCGSKFILRNLSQNILDGACENNEGIIAGCPVTPYEYPSLVSLQRKTKDETEYRHTCTAVLLSSHWVLTAAHCGPRRNKPPPPITTRPSKTRRPGRRPTVLHPDLYMAGDHNNSFDEGFEQPLFLVNPTNQLQHPDWSDGDKNSQHDLMLVKLDAPFYFTDKVKPVTMPTRPYRQGIFRAVGYGVSNWTPFTSPQIPTKVDLTTVSLEECRKMAPHDFIGDNMICAHLPNKDKSGCFGDSGGPLYHVRGDVHTLVGITSFGVGPTRRNCTYGDIAVFIDVYPYVDWIKKVMATY